MGSLQSHLLGVVLVYIVVSAAGAGVGAQIGNAVYTRIVKVEEMSDVVQCQQAAGMISPVPKAAKWQFKPGLQHSKAADTNR